MDKKKALKKVGSILLGLLMAPPKLLAWVLRHKIMTIFIAGASIWGYNKVSKTTDTESSMEQKAILLHKAIKKIQPQHAGKVSDGDVLFIPKIHGDVEQIPGASDAVVIQSQTNKNEVVHTVIDMPLNQNKEDVITTTVGTTQQKFKEDTSPTSSKGADSILSRKPLLSTPEYDMVNKDGNRVAPAIDRLPILIKQNAIGSGKPEKSGLKTLLIYSAEDTNRFSVVHLGYHKTESQQKREYKLYYSMPTLDNVQGASKSRFNVIFPEPGVQLGIQTDGQKVDLPEPTDKVPSIILDNKGGISVLKVDSFGKILSANPQESKEAVMRAGNLLKANADIISETFLTYPQEDWLKASEKVWEKEEKTERRLNIPRRRKVRLGR